MSLTNEVSDMIVETSFASVFGQKNAQKRIIYSHGGV